jgi:hypothetical protein
MDDPFLEGESEDYQGDSGEISAGIRLWIMASGLASIRMRLFSAQVQGTNSPLMDCNICSHNGSDLL